MSLEPPHPDNTVTILYMTVPIPMKAGTAAAFPHMIKLGTGDGKDVAKLCFRDAKIFEAAKTIFGSSQQMKPEVLGAFGAFLEDLLERENLQPRHATEFVAALAEAIGSGKNITVVDIPGIKSPSTARSSPTGNGGHNPSGQPMSQSQEPKR